MVAKSVWRLVSSPSLWQEAIVKKYLYPSSIIEWIRNPLKSKDNGSIGWKTTIISFDVVGNGLAWKVGKNPCIRVGGIHGLGVKKLTLFLSV